MKKSNAKNKFRAGKLAGKNNALVNAASKKISEKIPEKILVVKFGGSSLANAVQIRKVEEILKQDSNRRFVVVSAPGTDASNPYKITDTLYNLYYKSRSSFTGNTNYTRMDKTVDELLKIISERYMKIAKDLNIIEASGMVKVFMDELKHLLDDSQASVDDVASRGENFHARLIAKYLGAKFIDAQDLIHIDLHNNPDNEITMSWIKSLSAETGIVVIPGFYGNTSRDRSKPSIKTFSRGGSDLTGAIIAAGLDASLYENWTDQDGVMCINPKIVSDVKAVSKIPVIREMSFRECRELTYCGFSILNDETVIPARVRNIPINIRNTNNPSHDGTLIVDVLDQRTAAKPVRGIAGRDGLVKINVEKDLLVKESEFEMRVAELLLSRNVRYDLLSWIDSISIIIELKYYEPFENEIMSGFNALSHKPVHIQKDTAMISIIGDGMKNNWKVLLEISKILDKAKVDTRMMYQGPSGDIMLFVKSSDYKGTTLAIYKRLLL